MSVVDESERTIMRAQAPSQLVSATNCSIPQKISHGSTPVNVVSSPLPQPSYLPRAASKVITIRPSSSTTTPSSHALFKPYDFAQLGSGPMAVVYQQFQQQQQQQQIVACQAQVPSAVQQTHSVVSSPSLSVNRNHRACATAAVGDEQRSSSTSPLSFSTSPAPNGAAGMAAAFDSRYYSQMCVPRMRSVISRSSNSAFSSSSSASPQQQPHHYSTSNTNNVTTTPANTSLRVNANSRSTPVSSAEVNDSTRICSMGQQTSIGVASSSASVCPRYAPVNGYKPNAAKGSSSSSSTFQTVGNCCVILPQGVKSDATSAKQSGLSSNTHPSLLNTSATATTTNQQSSSDNCVVLPHSNMHTIPSSNSTPISTPTVTTPSHAGPSPRPSILRKTRDPSSSAGSAVRRLVMSADAPSSRPASCTSSFSSSPVLPDDASCSTKCASANSEIRALSATPSCNYDSSFTTHFNDTIVRDSNTASQESGAVTFLRVGDSPQRASEPETPRKRLRKQQFDSSQVSDKIKMEVSVHVDATKVDYQKEEIALWRLAPPGQTTENIPVPHGKSNEKKRRGRPRTESRIGTADLVAISTGDSAVSAPSSLNSAAPKPKKARKNQLVSSSSDQGDSVVHADISDNVDTTTGVVASNSDQPSKKRLTTKGLSSSRSAKTKKSVRSANETAEAETAAKTLSCFFQEIQRKTNEVVVPLAKEKPKTEPPDDACVTTNHDEETTTFSNHSGLTDNDDLCSLSSDMSDMSLEFASHDDEVHRFGTIPPKVDDLSLDGESESGSKAVYKRRPNLLSGYKMPTNTKLSHIERPECAKAYIERARLLKASRSSLKTMRRLAREDEAIRRVQIKNKLFSEASSSGSTLTNGTTSSYVDRKYVRTMPHLSNEELCSKTNAFFDEEASRSQLGYDEMNIVAHHRSSTHVKKSNERLTAAVTECCCSSNVDYMSQSESSRHQANKTNYEFNRATSSKQNVISDVLNSVIDQVVDWTDVNESGCKEELSGKVKKKKRHRIIRSTSMSESASGSMCATALMDSSDTSDKKWYSLMQKRSVDNKSKLKSAKDCVDEGIGESENMKKMFDNLIGQHHNGAYDDDYLSIEQERRELELALKDLNRKNYTSNSFVTDPATMFNATHERLLTVERNEAENEEDMLRLMIDFLRVTDRESYDQLLDDIEKDYDSDDDESTRQMKRRRRIVAFSVQVPRTTPSLAKRDLYNATRATNFHPTTADINQLFGMGSGYYRGHLSSKNPKAYVYLDRKGNRVKERFDVRRCRDYEFIHDSEMDDLRVNLSADLLKDEYENELDLMLTQYRVDNPEDDCCVDDEEASATNGSLTNSFGSMSIERRFSEDESKNVEWSSFSEEMSKKGHADDECDELQKPSSSIMAAVNVKSEDDGDSDVEIIGEKIIRNGDKLKRQNVPKRKHDRHELEPMNSDDKYYANGSSRVPPNQLISNSRTLFTYSECAQLKRRANNIREMFATLMHTLRVNSYLASSASEVFSEHVNEFVFNRSQSMISSPGDTSKGSNCSFTDAAVAGPSRE
ncbi:unnamed protein product [Anisakis simplex]|uniref:Serine-rich adhesin for platelets n=1 Tax=Anisakis simplex TaxID=6269 RepID=A0A0M3JU34_ANISI|nr:unnamed protein product [Anisakis simplex]